VLRLSTALTTKVTVVVIMLLFLVEMTGEARMEEINGMSLGEKQRIIPTLCSLGFHVLAWEDENEDDFCAMTVEWVTAANNAEMYASGNAFPNHNTYSYHPPTGPLAPHFLL
jgi:hypothetical protein